MKRFLSLLLIVLMMFSVLFVTISCKNDVAPATPEDTTPDTPAEDKTQGQKGDPILPKGTGQEVPRWVGVGEGGKTGLADFVTDGSKTNVTEQLVQAVKDTPQSFFAATPKRVIYIIGDGMGQNQLTASAEYKGELIMDYLPYKTESKTQSYDKEGKTSRSDLITTDSCAGGTQLLSGYKTRYGYISLDIDANPVKNLTEVAQENNWKTATVTNDHIADATPADSLVHNTNRYHQSVLYYQELMENMPDLLMGWDWGMGSFFEKDTWAARLDDAEKEAISDAYSRNKSDLPQRAGKTPIQYYKDLTAAQKTIFEPFSVYYHIWSTETDKSVAFATWLEDPAGLTAYCTDLDSSYGDPANHVFRSEEFGGIVANTDFSKPILGSWTDDGPDYDAKNPLRGYLMDSDIWPNFSEMVAYTLYQMDTMVEADPLSDGFFAMIENTCTDGWGHCKDKYKQKIPGFLNEIQCFDEGVAIAVKYVLEHPDTLLIISADHDTGNLTLREGWEDDYSLMKANSTDHSTKTVPCIAFGAGADKLSAASIAEAYGLSDGSVHEGWITGQIVGQLMGDDEFGQPAGYPN